MGEHWLPGPPPVRVEITRSARARRLTLRVSGRDGTVRLTLPRGVPLSEAVAFLTAREAWVRGHLARLRPPRVPQFGGTIPFEGAELRLRAHDGRGILAGEGEILVPGGPAELPARLRSWLRAAARDRLAAAADRHAAALGRRYAALTLRDTTSRWGSCSAQGALSFSWRLVMAPPAVLDYVAAHEVAHLERMDHSPAFWTVTARLCPDWKAQRAWLRREGGALLAIDFGGTGGEG